VVVLLGESQKKKGSKEGKPEGKPENKEVGIIPALWKLVRMLFAESVLKKDLPNTTSILSVI